MVRYCLDTSFFLKILPNSDAATRVLNRARSGRETLVLPTPVLMELRVVTTRRGNPDQYRRLRSKLRTFPGVEMEEFSVEDAELAADLKASHGLPSIDAQIYAVGENRGCGKIASLDPDYDRVRDGGMSRTDLGYDDA